MFLKDHKQDQRQDNQSGKSNSIGEDEVWFMVRSLLPSSGSFLPLNIDRLNKFYGDIVVGNDFIEKY